MNWLMNLSTRAKLLLAFGVTFGFTAAVVWTSLAGMARLDRCDEQRFSAYETSLGLAELRALENRSRNQALELTLSSHDEARASLRKQINDRAKEIDDLLGALQQDERESSTVRGKLKELQATIAAYRLGRESQFELLRQNRMDEVEALAAGSQRQLFEKFLTDSMALSKQLATTRERLSQESARTNTAVIRILSGVGAAALLVAIALGLLLTQVLAAPLRGISAAAERMAAGDLTVAIPAQERADEVGVVSRSLAGLLDVMVRTTGIAERVARGEMVAVVANGDTRVDSGLMAQSLQRMVETLTEITRLAERIAEGDLTASSTGAASDAGPLAQALNRMMTNLRRIIGELRQGIGVLGSSASEILSTTTQVAAGAQETATAVTQTTTTIEEVRQTALQAGDRAREVLASAERAARAAEDGRETVDQTVAGMEVIRGQMRQIAENAVRVSEQSRAIGAIAASVSDVADQSNLLAVNAAIEAAKAGEQGRGFSVVAQEIRSLAEQAKRATVQVRALLDDVQTAVNQAVMATDEGAKAVENGNVLAQRSGQTIALLAGTVADAAQVAGLIVATAEQQVVGMNQVVPAMESIKLASEQNVTGTHQAAQAARNLHDLGRGLERIVTQFNV